MFSLLKHSSSSFSYSFNYFSSRSLLFSHSYLFLLYNNSNINSKYIIYKNYSFNSSINNKKNENIYPSFINIQYKDNIYKYEIKNKHEKITDLIKEVGEYYNIPETYRKLKYIQNTHSFLTQDILDSYISLNNNINDLFNDNNNQNNNVFIELYNHYQSSRSYFKGEHNEYSDLYPIIIKHINDFCVDKSIPKQIVKKLNSQISDNDFNNKILQSYMKSIYPQLLRFQNISYSMLSHDEKTLLGENPDLSIFEVSQILLPLFIQFFSTKDPTSIKLLLSFNNSNSFDNTESSRNTRHYNKTLAYELANLGSPHTWYPLARDIKRNIILHIGPTNSGKTHTALESLKKAKSGIYCGPLRLLAQEIYERFLNDDIPISLLTGQIRNINEQGTHVSCTVEMADVNTIYNCAVIDEIQMISDPDRGWAWARVLLGIAAKEIHLCGNETVIDIIKDIVESCGDTLTIENYTRLSPLKVPQEPIETIDDLTQGDCIITFSRKNIFSIKQQIEKELKQKCCVIYGKLPPETRSQQAKLFNTNNSSYPFLISTDAIGMGLNLNIRRVVFSTLEKFDGTTERRLTPSEVKQIAGRAGRFKSIYPTGFATTFETSEQKYIKYAIKTELNQSEYAGILPVYEQIELFAMGTQKQNEYGEEKPFSEILEEFSTYATVDNIFFLCGFSSMLDIAILIDHIDLSLKDRYAFCLAPCQVKNEFVSSMLRKYATLYSRIDNKEYILPQYNEYDSENENNVPLLLNHSSLDGESLEKLENIYSVLDLYVWLSWRFKEFTDRDLAFDIQKDCNKRIESVLNRQSSKAILRKKRKHKKKNSSKKRHR